MEHLMFCCLQQRKAFCQYVQKLKKLVKFDENKHLGMKETSHTTSSTTIMAGLVIFATGNIIPREHYKYYCNVCDLGIDGHQQQKKRVMIELRWNQDLPQIHRFGFTGQSGLILLWNMRPLLLMKTQDQEALALQTGKKFSKALASQGKFSYNISYIFR